MHDSRVVKLLGMENPYMNCTLVVNHNFACKGTGTLRPTMCVRNYLIIVVHMFLEDV